VSGSEALAQSYQVNPQLQFPHDELLRGMSDREQRLGWMIFAGLVILIIWALTRSAVSS
jgi:hypothetical protein